MKHTMTITVSRGEGRKKTEEILEVEGVELNPMLPVMALTNSIEQIEEMLGELTGADVNIGFTRE